MVNLTLDLTRVLEHLVVLSIDAKEIGVVINALLIDIGDTSDSFYPTSISLVASITEVEATHAEIVSMLDSIMSVLKDVIHIIFGGEVICSLTLTHIYKGYFFITKENTYE